jgi:coenzyme F420-0:L-glutamate ligase/coenzyme F420-1:gamma-L-glutamate ligase
LLLPLDPDASAQRLRESLQTIAGCRLGVVISDSFGRAWRNGTVNVAIGAAGITSLWDRRGEHDRSGRALESTVIAWADAAAAAAGLLMGEADEGTPVVIVKGLSNPSVSNPAAALIRPVAEDMFL